MVKRGRKTGSHGRVSSEPEPTEAWGLGHQVGTRQKIAKATQQSHWYSNCTPIGATFRVPPACVILSYEGAEDDANNVE